MTMSETMDELAVVALKVKRERDAFRTALVKIMDTVYAKDQEEITRLNDIYDTARDAVTKAL